LTAAVHEAVYDDICRAVHEAVRDEVGDAVHEAVRDEVRDEVGRTVRDAVDDAVVEAVYDEVGRAVDEAVGDEVDREVGRAVHEDVRDAVRDAVGDDISWHYWLGGQFWCGGWWGGPCFVSFFTDVCGLELSDDIAERAAAYRRICESVNYFWVNRSFVMVCARPVAINRDERGRLHNETGMSIRYPDGWGLFHLHGVAFAESLYWRVVGGEMTAEEIMQIDNADQRVQAMRYARNGVRDFFAAQGGKCIDAYIKQDAAGNVIPYELWELPADNPAFGKRVCFAVYGCPSSLGLREYCKGVPNVKTVPQAMSWGMSDDLHVLAPETWEKLVPLVDEA